MANRVRLTVSRAKAQAVLEALIRDGENVIAAAESVRDDRSFEEWKATAKRWRNYTKSALQSICRDDALAEEFDGSAHVGVSFISMGPTPVGELLRSRVESRTQELESLQSMVDRLEFFEADEPEVMETPNAGGPSTSDSTRVFVVHGRQRNSADVVARFLARLELEPIILDEQANEGRTILEKLEANTEDVGFAVVLLQADDLGRGPDDDDWPESPNRARQNVILELGFFVGKIGRGRVAALVEPTVEQPSDILGLAYVPFDDTWQMRLGRELKVAYPGLDLNLAFS